MCMSNYHLDLFFYTALYCTALHCTALPCFILLCLASRRVCIALIHHLSFDLYCTERERLIILCNRLITSLSLFIIPYLLIAWYFRTSNNSIKLLYFIKRMLSPNLFFFLDVCVRVSVSVFVFVSFCLC